MLDDRDSVWSDFAPSAFAFFPKAGNKPGIDDEFQIGFFNDYNADYWFITGVPVVPNDGKKRIGNTGTIHPSSRRRWADRAGVISGRRERSRRRSTAVSSGRRSPSAPRSTRPS